MTNEEYEAAWEEHKVAMKKYDAIIDAAREEYDVATTNFLYAVYNVSSALRNALYVPAGHTFDRGVYNVACWLERKLCAIWLRSS